MPEDNLTDEILASYEETAVDSRLRNLLELSAFPKLTLLPYLVNVQNVIPCPSCGAPVARVLLSHEFRVYGLEPDDAENA